MTAGTPTATATDALEWMRDLQRRESLTLFRGQRQIYPTIYPSLMRDDVSQAERKAWWRVLTWFVSARNGITGYAIPGGHHAHAVVQHYLEHSSLIDLTGTPEVALYFALAMPEAQARRVVYAISTDALVAAGLVVTDHDFIGLPLGEGGHRHRWLRQDGFTVGPEELAALPSPGDFDLLTIPGLQSFEFTAAVGEDSLRTEMGDLLSVAGDPLAASVRSVFMAVARSQQLAEDVRRLVEKSQTVDAHALLIAELQGLLALAQAQNSKRVGDIQRLLDDATAHIWDTGYEASLQFLLAEIASEKSATP